MATIHPSADPDARWGLRGRAIMARAVDAFGRLDAVFADAGGMRTVAPTAEYPDDAFDDEIAVNLRGVFLTLKHALPIMSGQGSGSIVVTGSPCTRRSDVGRRAGHRRETASRPTEATQARSAIRSPCLLTPPESKDMINDISPTVVLVHGAFADASHWTPVIKELQARDVPVLAPANPLRGLAGDAAYIASYVNQIDGPVLLVGHSYGGAVISVAGAAVDQAVGLVYVAAWILDEGESFADVAGRFPATALGEALRPSTYPLADGGTAVELSVAPEAYRTAFAADLPSAATDPAAIGQRPWAAIFEDRAQAAAWKHLPSWAVVATADQAIHPDAERHMARRAGAGTIEADASHSIALSQPRVVADLIHHAITRVSATEAVSP